MKEGLSVGEQQTYSTTVTPDMAAQFHGKVVHPVYSTVAMVYHMEWVARKVILPYLEEHEEGMGAEVSVRHIQPAALNSEVTLCATVTEYKKNKVVTKVSVMSNEREIGAGQVTQFILPKETIKQNITKTQQ